MSRILWEPPTPNRSRLARWMAERGFDTYEDAWRWSIDDLDGFWSSMWSTFDVVAATPPATMLGDRRMPGATWCPGARLNYAENALARLPEGVALSSRSQTRDAIDITGPQLRDQVARTRAGLVRLGVRPGDRVVAYLPNIAEAAIAMLAAASLGATWASCPPEFGPKGVIDRFAQIKPTVLLAVDGYHHRGKRVDRRDDLTRIRAALPTLRAMVGVPYPDFDGATFPQTTSWEALLSEPAELRFEPVAFDHPLYVLFSSGTTGLPKPIVHGHGGILLEHLKVLGMHHDLGGGDRFFWFSTTGWMMWNYLVSGLAVGASIVMFDGDPSWPTLDTVWELAAAEGLTHLGTSAPFLMACRKGGIAVPSLPTVREVGSTGAPLPAEGFEWVYSQLPDVRLSSISGGTDVCSAFVGGAPVLPVVAGEISGRCLGVAAYAFDASGQPVVGEEGNLVITAPMPSMPVGLWGDTDGSRYRAAYFERFPGVWDHGDWITFTPSGTCVISGRSDSTLNRGGVRLGTSEFYAVVEDLPYVLDSLVVHAGDELLLFVVLAPGAALDPAAIRDALRTSLSPRHVPDRILSVPAIPRTLSGKKLEVPLKRLFETGRLVASRDALADPSALDAFEELAISLRDGPDR